MAQSYLESGVDLISLPCLTAADVQQAIAAAKPRDPYAFVVTTYDDDPAPDVVTTPELARFIWLRILTTPAPTAEFYYYDGSSWTLLSIVDGNLIANNSIPLTKIKLTGALPFDIIQVNAAGTLLNYISVVNAIQNGSLPVAKLVSGGASHLLVSIAGINQFLTIASFPAQLTDNTVPIEKIVRGGISDHGLFLRTFEDGTLNEWVDFDPNEQIDLAELLFTRISGIGFGALQYIRRNAANNAWEGVSGINAQPVPVFDTNVTVAATVEVTVTKPADSAWLDFELQYTGSFTDTNVGSARVDFTYQTAPEAGNAPTVGASSGTGNGGQVFMVNNSDDAISPTWIFKGRVPVTLQDVDVLTLRATITLVAATQSTGAFMIKANYV